ncbi:ABC transporter permease [Alsobacter sp. SYSU M60028]|uniref:ABC transporter permease n=1 Tax=Alsobacter ponti TaxID=2962936 RepID=A0ABT1LHS6_9HYPH|nr:ABC transporter permease [Alsobacter ponti]MCP8941054.1 ABC transporter permease [Alsobacter ponti]
MASYLLRRLVLTLPVLAGIVVITFLLTRLSGDPTDLMLPPNATDEAREAFRSVNGLDRPLWEQFVVFAGRALMGDFGASLRFQQPAMGLVVERLPATIELAFATMALALVVGIPAGVVSAYHRGSATDTSIRTVMLLGQAVPSFFLGVLGIIVFAVWLRWLPTGGRGSLAQLVLPATTLAFNLVALIARVTRSCMLDVLKQDYVRTARAKGVWEARVVWLHALRNAFIPVLTVIGLQFGLLLGGVVVTETIFSWPGVGRLAIQAIYARDFPVVQAVVFVFAVAFVLVNLVVDLLYAALDPRISYK